MSAHPRGCYVELVDGRTACYGHAVNSNGVKFHSITVNGGGITVVGDNQIKVVDDQRPGWKLRAKPGEAGSAV